MLSEIGQIAVNVHDLDRAVSFYRDVLEMPFLFEAPGMGFFKCGEVRLMLAIPETKELDHPASIIYYRVADMEKAHDALRSRGVAFERAPAAVYRTETQELWMAFFRDPDRNVLALMSEVPIQA